MQIIWSHIFVDCSPEPFQLQSVTRMGDHALSDSFIGSKIAWSGDGGDGVVRSWRWVTSSSGALGGNEVP